MIKFLKPKPGVRMYNSALEHRDLHIDYDVSELMNEIYPLKEEVILEWQKSWHEKQDEEEPLIYYINFGMNQCQRLLLLG